MRLPTAAQREDKSERVGPAPQRAIPQEPVHALPPHRDSALSVCTPEVVRGGRNLKWLSDGFLLTDFLGERESEA